MPVSDCLAPYTRHQRRMSGPIGPAVWYFPGFGLFVNKKSVVDYLADMIYEPPSVDGSCHTGSNKAQARV